MTIAWFGRQFFDMTKMAKMTMLHCTIVHCATQHYSLSLSALCSAATLSYPLARAASNLLKNP